MRLPEAASRQAPRRLRGSPCARAKSLAVPAAITASGFPDSEAATATAATVPSPPATTRRSASEAAAARSSPSSKTVTSAPAWRRALSTAAVLRPEPDAALTIRAAFTRIASRLTPWPASS